MAPDRSVGSPGRQDETHRLPRNHQTRHPRSHREPAHGGHESGQRPAGAPHPRPSGGLRALAGAMEKGAAVALGRTRAVGGRAADRGARTRDHRIPVDPLLPGCGAVPCGRRSRQDAFQGGTHLALRDARGSRNVPARHDRRRVHGGQSRRKTGPALPCTAFHDLDSATGSRTQAGHVGLADHVGGAAPL